MLMHECRVRRNDATNHRKRRYEKEISLFRALSPSLNYTTNVKRTVTTHRTRIRTHTHVLLSFPFLRTECDKIDELRNRIYITGPIPYSCTLFFVSISHSVSRFIFIWNIQLTCAACLHSLYTVIHRFILSTQARTFHKNYQCLRTNSTSTRCLK